jgi:two-component system, OmpR family, sensor kinase
MKVRTRLVLSFAYVLLVVIVSLTIPLAIVLRDRARSELEALALTNAQTIAALLDRDRLDDGPAAVRTLVRDSRRYAHDVGGRVVILDADGTVIADSDGSDLGQDYVTPGRPEVSSAFDSVATSFIRYSRDEGGSIVVAAAPIIDGGNLVGVVRISRNVQQVQANVARATAAIVIVALASMVAGLAIAFALAGSLARPLTRLAATARRLGRGDLSSRAGTVEGADELRELGDSFDEMADRVERTVRAQREFVANASHQLRTPLTGMKLRLEAAGASDSDEAIAAHLQAADREVDRLAEIVDRLLLMARRVEEGQTEVADLPQIVGRAVERWSDRAAAAGSTLRATGDCGLALANPADLDQLLDTLIDNAIAYAPGAIEIDARRDGDRIVLAVADHGPGIRPEERLRVTERFYRGTEAPPGGSGLGLAIARELAEASGGTLRVDGDNRGGTRVEIILRPVEGGAASS